MTVATHHSTTPPRPRVGRGRSVTDIRGIIGVDLDTDAEMPECIDADMAVEILRRMILVRTFDERAVTYHRHGRIGTYPLSWGQEALQVAAVSASRVDDWIMPSYREGCVGVLRGMAIDQLLAYWRGHPTGFWSPGDFHVAPVSVPVGSHVLHAVGAAWGEKIRGTERCSIAMFGDGATSEGDVHEALNMAGVMSAPVVFLCSNNGWAISTPLERQTKNPRLADKAIGYGIRSERVDGTDVLAVFAAIDRALRRGRDGDGPTFIEAVSYRARQHATADDPSRYRSDDEAARWREKECVGRYERYLIRHGLIADGQGDIFREEALTRMAEGIAKAEALEPGTVDSMFGNVFANEPASYARDRREIAALRDGEVA